MIKTEDLWGDSATMPDGLPAKEAYKYARQFVDSYVAPIEPNLKLSAGCSPSGCCSAILSQFLEDLGIEFVKVDIGYDDYASWVIPLSDASSVLRIAISPNQLEKWNKESGLPIETMYARIMIHEFAHKLFHKRLVAGGHVYLSREDKPSSTPKEEEQAWIFAFLFFTFLIGDSSFMCRTMDVADNTAARFV